MLKRLLKHEALAPLLGSLFVGFIVLYGKVLMATCRVKVVTPIPPQLTAGPVVLALWHQQLVAIPFLHAPNPCPLTALMSASKDGTMMQRVGKHFGIGAASGSSHRQALSATLRLVKQSQNGHSLSITPDGPRGPAFQAKPGAVAIAAMAGVPLIPCAAAYGTALQFGSWDAFRLPLPFSALFLAYGKPEKKMDSQHLTSTLTTLSHQAACAAGLDTPR